jgi:hypothetical protein
MWWVELPTMNLMKASFAALAQIARLGPLLFLDESLNQNRSARLLREGQLHQSKSEDMKRLDVRAKIGGFRSSQHIIAVERYAVGQPCLAR